MKILLTCKEFPHSKVIGGPIIIYNRLKHLSKNHLVSLAAFSREEDEKYVSSVEGYCHDLKLIPLPPKRSPLKTTKDFFFSPIPHYFLRVHDSPKMSKTIADMVAKDHYDFVIGEYSVMGQFIHKNPLLPPVRRIISVHECYYLARLKDYRFHKWGRKKLRELINLKGLKKYEFDMYSQADKVLTLTPQGRDELLAIRPDLDIAIVPHGVDVEHFSYSDPSEGEQSVVFVGNYLHYPNVDAVLYFHQEIWSKVKAICPKLKFIIVGKSPPLEIQDLTQDESITVTGRVDDVTPYIREGQIFICPVRLGGGFRGKILEAMAVGRPIVSTSLGAEGIPSKNGENIIIADDTEDFAVGIEKLLKDRDLYERIRQAGRKLVAEKYAWAKGVEVLEGILEEMIKIPPK
ncbi:MAG TPA: glycosyltransferase [Candidatus Heimdallarchaeota archaeon]|nr:glycosyltransferase [Candidatus Heimdallarchaeota archaeon]